MYVFEPFLRGIASPKLMKFWGGAYISFFPPQNCCFWHSVKKQGFGSRIIFFTYLKNLIWRVFRFKNTSYDMFLSRVFLFWKSSTSKHWLFSQKNLFFVIIDIFFLALFRLKHPFFAIYRSIFQASNSWLYVWPRLIVPWLFRLRYGRQPILKTIDLQEFMPAIRIGSRTMVSWKPLVRTNTFQHTPIRIGSKILPPIRIGSKTIVFGFRYV